MPGERTEVVTRAFAAFERGDTTSFHETVDPNVVITQFPEQPDVRPYHGYDGLRRVMDDWIGTWDDWSLTITDMREVGENVLVALDQRGRGKTSGIEMQIDTYFVFTVPEGLITRWQMFTSERQALEAAGGAGD